MSLTPAQKTGITIATLLSLAGAVAGTIAVTVTGAQTTDAGVCATSVAIPFPEPAPEPSTVRCKRVEVVGPSAAWSAIPGLCPGWGAAAVACGVEVEGRADEPDLPSGIRQITGDEEVPYPGDGVQLRLWMNDDPGFAAHVACACGPRSGAAPCLVTEQAPGGQQTQRQARPGEYLSPGTFSGAGCVPRSCFETSEAIAEGRQPGYSMPDLCK